MASPANASASFLDRPIRDLLCCCSGQNTEKRCAQIALALTIIAMLTLILIGACGHDGYIAMHPDTSACLMAMPGTLLAAVSLCGVFAWCCHD